MANAEDLNRLTSCSLVLLGHIFLSLGNSQEALNMVTPAMQLASKIPDVHVQLWASALLKGKLFWYLIKSGQLNTKILAFLYSVKSPSTVSFLKVTMNVSFQKSHGYNAFWMLFLQTFLSPNDQVNNSSYLCDLVK